MILLNNIHCHPKDSLNTFHVHFLQEVLQFSLVVNHLSPLLQVPFFRQDILNLSMLNCFNKITLLKDYKKFQYLKSFLCQVFQH